MKSTLSSLRLFGLGLLAFAVFSGCETGGSGNVSASFYYGVGFYDPWYYGDYHHHGDIIVTPPPNRPEAPPHVEHPIAKPPPSTTPRPTPTPSIPSRPRGSFRR